MGSGSGIGSGVGSDGDRQLHFSIPFRQTEAVVELDQLARGGIGRDLK